ncbi:uncharacterized protein V6R79_004874 [Siganus canaliculatus]
MAHSFTQEYFQIPVVTRAYTTACVLTTAAVAFIIMLVYVWSRRHPLIRMNFFGLLNFQAPFLPWVLMGFSLLLGNSIVVDLLGISVGHMYYFLEDVFPNQPGGRKLLMTPELLRAMFDEPEDPDYGSLHEARQDGDMQQNH